MEKIWMKVTRDVYELPIYVAHSAVELAKMTGLSPESIRCMASRGTGGIRKVEIEEVDEEWTDQG